MAWCRARINGVCRAGGLHGAQRFLVQRALPGLLPAHLQPVSAAASSCVPGAAWAMGFFAQACTVFRDCGTTPLMLLGLVGRMLHSSARVCTTPCLVSVQAWACLSMLSRTASLVACMRVQALSFPPSPRQAGCTLHRCSAAQLYHCISCSFRPSAVWTSLFLWALVAPAILSRHAHAGRA